MLVPKILKLMIFEKTCSEKTDGAICSYVCVGCSVHRRVSLRWCYITRGLWIHQRLAGHVTTDVMVVMVTTCACDVTWLSQLMRLRRWHLLAWCQWRLFPWALAARSCFYFLTFSFFFDSFSGFFLNLAWGPGNAINFFSGVWDEVPAIVDFGTFWSGKEQAKYEGDII